MPPRRKTNKSSKDESDDGYRKKRERNNQAVKLCREKSKKKIEETEKRIENLRDANIQLGAIIKELKRNAGFLKTCLLKADESEERKIAVQKIFDDENE